MRKCCAFGSRKEARSARSKRPWGRRWEGWRVGVKRGPGEKKVLKKKNCSDGFRGCTARAHLPALAALYVRARVYNINDVYGVKRDTGEEVYIHTRARALSANLSRVTAHKLNNKSAACFFLSSFHPLPPSPRRRPSTRSAADRRNILLYNMRTRFTSVLRGRRVV